MAPILNTCVKQIRDWLKGRQQCSWQGQQEFLGYRRGNGKKRILNGNRQGFSQPDYIFIFYIKINLYMLQTIYMLVPVLKNVDTVMGFNDNNTATHNFKMIFISPCLVHTLITANCISTRSPTF